FYSTGESGDGVPSVLGGFAVIQHDKNLRSVYGHLLLDEALRSDKKTSFAADDTLGTVSDTGLTQSPELYLAIKDLSLNQSVNPCLVLPRIEERTRPTIRGVVLSSGSTVIALGASVRVPAGEWEIFADIFDEAALAYFRPCAVYRTAVSVNGQEIFQLAFDALKEKDGLTRVYPSRDLAFRDVYSGEWRMKFGRVYLQRGMANLEIRVRDFAGNERAQSFQFRVE
ncbi:MAG: M23 family metallopeptidase, partial [Spirochaetales bacterium]|nr:M23 family metallopeptidase [Spirochaetales bacterium]